MPERQTYLNFTDVSIEGRKTKMWRVMSTSGSYLGVVKWFGRWRCYCFFPNLDTVYNDGCLEDLTDFCRNETRAHRSAAKYERDVANGVITKMGEPLDPARPLDGR